MRKKTMALSILVLAMAMLLMISCSGSSFSMQAVDDKTMNITAEKADEGDSVVSGSLVVGEDEQITIDTNLDKGGVTVDFISDEGFDNSEEVPDIENAEATYTTNVSGVESQTVSFGTGSYVVRATATDKANGTIEISVK